MIKFRESNLIKSLCLFLATTLFYISCSSDYIESQADCSNFSIVSVDKQSIAHNMELMLNYAKTLDDQEDFTTFGEYHETLFGKSEPATRYVNTFDDEADKYSRLGFEGYVNTSKYLSGELKNYLVEYSGSLLSFLKTRRPDLRTFTQFVDDKILNLDSSKLCKEDQELVSVYLSATQGYANWYYKHFFSENNDTYDAGEAQARMCNFWEAIGCGALALLVGTVVAIAAGFVVAIATIFITDKDGNRTEVKDKELQNNISILAGFALGLTAGVNVYNWCCGQDEVEEQDCDELEGAVITQTDCNEFVYRLFGPSNYGDTEWKNENTDPSNIITPYPTLRFSVPTLGEESHIFAKATCIPGPSSLEIFEWKEDETFDSDVDLFPLEWSKAPPATWDYVEDEEDYWDNYYIVRVNTPNGDAFNYTWSINSPHEIIGGGTSWDNQAEVWVGSSQGEVIITCTAENTCLNQTDVITGTTTIQ